MIAYPAGRWARELLTLSRAETIAYFLDDDPKNQQDGFSVGNGTKPVYPVQHILQENLDEAIVLITDHRLYSNCKLRLESLGLIENVHFFDGWRLNINFYRQLEPHSSWLEFERDSGNVDFSQWEKRAQIMSAMIPADIRSIMDMGCGDGTLRKYLPPDVRYYGLDVVKRMENTIVCDVNNAPLPAISVDAYYMAGFLMYVNDIAHLFMQMRDAKYLIFSTMNYSLYLRLDTIINPDCRVVMNTRCHYVWFSDIINALMNIGFIVEKVIPVDASTSQYLWRARNTHWDR